MANTIETLTIDIRDRDQADSETFNGLVRRDDGSLVDVTIHY